MREQGPAWVERPREVYEVIERFDTKVAPKGDAALYVVQFEGGRTLKLRIQIEQIGALQNSLKQSYNALAVEQRWKPQIGGDALWNLIQSAQTPDGFDIMTDPLNGDLVFVYRFRNQAPMALRVDLAKCLENMGHASRMIRALAN